ncbi:LysE family transporter [Serratia marcescens]|nr:LysE family transporter [Serratia marcescens]MBH2866158.1 LysE family transporter [Serratia marcescens]MBW4239739.1 LysE family transporter [Enterobacter roggenkampii]
MGVPDAACSDLILISAVVLGLGAVMVSSEALFSVVKWRGMIYLLWLAVALLRAKGSSQISLEENSLFLMRLAEPPHLSEACLPHCLLFFWCVSTAISGHNTTCHTSVFIFCIADSSN